MAWKPSNAIPTKTKSQSAETTANFFVSAPHAKSVGIAGSFNNWNPNSLKLTRDSQGNWKGSIRLKPGRYEYRVFADGQWMDDAGAKESVPNSFGTRNTILVVK